MNDNELKYFHFKGIKIDNVGLDDIVETIVSNRHNRGYVCVNDVRSIMYATKDSVLYDAINNSLLSVADGTPLAWYGKLIGCKNIRRVAGFDLMSYMLENNKAYKHFLLGDTEQTINRVIEKAKKTNNDLQIVGHSPPFRKDFSEEENVAIFERINYENPDVVWVAFGGAKQEKWMHQNIQRLGRGVMVGVGAAFRFYVGDLYVPPLIVQKLGMQWFFRVMGKPASIPKNIRYRSLFVYYFLKELKKGRDEVRRESAS